MTVSMFVDYVNDTLCCMEIRRIARYWMFVAVVVLPAWVLIGRGILGSSMGWDLLLYIFLCPILGLALLAVAGLTVARKAVREQRAVSWTDLAVIAVWHGAIIAYGFWDSTPLAVLVVAGAIAAFWIAAWQLFSETRSRVKGVIAGFEEAARMPQQPRSPHDGREHEVIVIEPGDDSAQR